MRAAASDIAATSMCSTRSVRVMPLPIPGPTYNQRNMSSFVIQKLFAACMADPVVGKEDDQRLIQQAFMSQTIDHTSHVLIRKPD
jgi:hypothetical protein